MFQLGPEARFGRRVSVTDVDAADAESAAVPAAGDRVDQERAAVQGGDGAGDDEPAGADGQPGARPGIQGRRVA